MIARRDVLAGMVAGVAVAPVCAAVAVPRLPRFFDDLAERTFRFFWETANADNGLVRIAGRRRLSRASPRSVSRSARIRSGVERGWITRAQARTRTLATLRFFDTAPSGPGAIGVTGYKGFFYHFLDLHSGLRFRDVELSTVDTALLHLGMLHVAAWFDADRPDEHEIRTRATRIVDRADWPWFQKPSGAISMGWHPGKGFIDRNWDGFNEGMMVYILALGSGGHPVADGAWDVWTKPYPGFWRGEGPTRRLAFAPLFGHQYSQMWIDFRGIHDAPMRQAGLDYVENSRRATYADRAYCIANPMGWDGYGRDLWGLTACDGPGDVRLMVGGRERTFFGYSARGPVGEPDGRDDGTIAPTAALGSLAFAPEIAIPAGRGDARLRRRHTLWPLRVRRLVQSQLSRTRRASRQGQGGSALRVDRRRLSGDRPRTDPGRDRQLSRRIDLACDASFADDPAWPDTRGIYRRVARAPQDRCELTA